MVGIYARAGIFNTKTQKYRYIFNIEQKDSFKILLTGFCFISKVHAKIMIHGTEVVVV